MDPLELANLWQTIKQSLQQRHADLKTMFEAIDTNQSGAIELDELKNELKTNHGITSDDQIHELFDFLNPSKSGAVNADEFESRWSAADQLVKQAKNHLQFQKLQQPQQQQLQQPQQQLFLQQQQQSAQQFSDLFRSSVSANSPTKYINIQGDYQLYKTPPKVFSPFRLSLSPPKPENFPKSKAQIQNDRFRDIQRQITRLFNNKPDAKNSTPRLKKDFQDYVNQLKLGSKPQRISSNTSSLGNIPGSFRNQLGSFRNQTGAFRIPNRPRLSLPERGSPRSYDQISLQNYAYQFQDRKMEYRQTFGSFLRR